MSDALLFEDNYGPEFARASSGRRGLALVAGFWVVITAILAARVALFDAIASGRLVESVSVHLAALTSVASH